MFIIILGVIVIGGSKIEFLILMELIFSMGLGYIFGIIYFNLEMFLYRE